MKAIAGMIGEADHDLLRLAPEGCDTVQVGNVDLIAAFKGVWELAAFMEEDVPENAYEQAMAALGAMVGMDIEAGLFSCLTGDMVACQWFDDLDQYPSELSHVTAFGLSDADPLAELLEILEPLLSDLNGEFYEEDGHATLAMDLSPDSELVITVTDDLLLFGSSANHVQALAERGSTRGADGKVDETTLSAAHEELDGCALAVFDAEFAVFAMRASLEMGGDDELLEQLSVGLDAFEDQILGPCLAEFVMTESAASLRIMTR